MRTSVPEKVIKIASDIEAQGNASLTRLTVLKKWFEQRLARLIIFGLWIARKAAGRKGKTQGEYGALLDEARQLISGMSSREALFQKIDPAAARGLYERAHSSQSTYQNQNWGAVRIVHSWPLMLVEKGLALHIGLLSHSSDGYKLAADWTQNYDPRFGDGLNGPSVGKLDELTRFMFSLEALEGR